MIIVCKNCKSSFLVSASIFSGGPRRVKCARCAETWLASPPTKTKPSNPTSPPKSMPNKDEEKTQPQVEKLPTEEVELQPPPFLSEKLKKHLFIGGGIGFSLFLILGLLFVLLQNQIIHIWPEAQQIYISLNLAQPLQEDALLLQKIHSIRRHQDGGMYLIVEGELFNQSKKIQIIPPLTVDAMGLNGKIIESWRIEPSQATIKAGAVVSFSSAILSPKESVVEVNLRFVEPSHDE